MEFSELQELVKQRLTIKQIAIHQKVCQKTVKTWLRKFNLKTARGPGGKLDRTVARFHCNCGEIDPNKFYGNKVSICGKCQTKYNLLQGQKKRVFALGLLGSKCSRCSYDKCSAALDIHHLNPLIKDFNFKSLRGWKEERIRKELISCILLCSNCHREEHNSD